jgi:hypothetical protein
MIAMIHPISASTSPRPPPRMSLIMSPAQVTRSLYSKPVVVSNKAVLVDISEFTQVIIYVDNADPNVKFHTCPR